MPKIATALTQIAGDDARRARNGRAVDPGDRVKIISQDGADPASGSFDAVAGGRARGKDA